MPSTISALWPLSVARNLTVSPGWMLNIQPGDTVRFLATDKGHNAEIVEGMTPAGTKSYAVKCKPHYAMGMVALIIVGKPDNDEQAAKITHPGRAKQIFGNLFGKAAP